MKAMPLALLLFAVSDLGAKPIPREECVVCHENVDLAKFHRKSHGGLLCVNCHASIVKLPHEDKVLPVVCGKCHSHEAEDYKASVHNLAALKGVAHAATCTSCHGPAHDIVSPRSPESKVARKQMGATCGTCHPKAFLEALNTRLPHRASRMGMTPDQVK